MWRMLIYDGVELEHLINRQDARRFVQPFPLLVVLYANYPVLRRNTIPDDDKLYSTREIIPTNTPRAYKIFPTTFFSTSHSSLFFILPFFIFYIFETLRNPITNLEQLIPNHMNIYSYVISLSFIVCFIFLFSCFFFHSHFHSLSVKAVTI
jgi:magnesium-transporting ATPase (P-type)